MVSIVAAAALGADPAAIGTWFWGAVDGMIARIQAGYAVNRNSAMQYLTRHGALHGARVSPAAGSLDVGRLRKRLEITGPIGFKSAIAHGQSTDEALRHMSTNMAGVADEAVRNGDRDVITQTATSGRGVVGWRRRLSGRACGFCAMLASRGAVYVNRASATVAKDGMAFHPHCHCWAEPLYQEQDEPASVRRLQGQWRRVTAGRRGKDAQRAWMRHWDQATPRSRVQMGLPARPGGSIGTPGAQSQVRPILLDAKSPDAVSRVLAAEYRRITGHDVRVDLKGSVDTAREHAEGVLRVIDRYPDIQLDEIATGRLLLSYAELDGRRLIFSERYSSLERRQRYLSELAGDGDAHWHPFDSPVGMAVHEMGHALDVLRLQRSARAQIDELVQSHGGPAGAKRISGYAETNTDEFIAEAFADAMMNGPRATPLSRAVLDVLDAEYARAVPGGAVVRAAPRKAAKKAAKPVASIPMRAEHLQPGDSLVGYGGVIAWRVLEVRRVGGGRVQLFREQFDGQRDSIFVDPGELFKLATPTPAKKAAAKKVAKVAPPAAPVPSTVARARITRATKSRTDRAAGYPERYPVPSAKAPWTARYPGYDPPDYTAPVVFDQDRTVRPGGWADPPDPRAVGREFTSFEGPVVLDELGRPMNPFGRTGIQGRGMLGKWGQNPAADPIITRYNPDTGKLEMAVIRRGDTDEWAIPGGMVDDGEQALSAAAREFLEETGADLDMSGARQVYRGYVDDPRNTDNAWMETTVMHRHLSPEEAARVRFGDAGLQTGEIRAVRWEPVTPEFVSRMYASHGTFVREALKGMPRRQAVKAAKKAAPAKAVKAAPAKKAAPRKAAATTPRSTVREVPRGVDTPPASAADIARARADISSARRGLSAYDRSDFAGSPFLSEFRDKYPSTYGRLVQEARIDASFARWVEKHGLTGKPEQIRAAVEREMREQLTSSRIVVRRRTLESLRGMLRSGRMKTQFETRRSRAMYDPKRRAEFERMTWGYADDLDPTMRPVYGYLSPDDLDESAWRSFFDAQSEMARGRHTGIHEYGGIRVVLKDDVRERTSFTVGDSLLGERRPSSMTDPDWRSFEFGTFGDGPAPGSDWWSPEFQWRVDYVESQIHGGVTVGDIAEVIFDERPPADVIALLERNSVPWRLTGEVTSPTKAAKKAAPAKKATPRKAATPPAPQRMSLAALKTELEKAGVTVPPRTLKPALVDEVTALRGGATPAQVTARLSGQARVVEIHQLMDADDAAIEAALRDVYEGQFGPYTTKVTVHIRRAGTKTDSRGRVRPTDPSIGVDGKIFDSTGRQIGYFGRTISTGNVHYADGRVRRETWAEHSTVQLEPRFQGKGFGAAFNQRAIEWYRASGVHGISLSDHNGYVWASQGFGFAGGVVPEHVVSALRASIADLRADRLKDQFGIAYPKALREAADLDAQLDAAEDVLRRATTLQPGDPRYPTARELSQIGRTTQRGKTSTWLGKHFMFNNGSTSELVLNPGEGVVVS